MHTRLPSALSNLETVLLDTGLVLYGPQTEVHDTIAHDLIQRSWQSPEAVARNPDVQNPEDWHNRLYACVGGEFFVRALEGCQRVLDVGCGEGWPSLYLARSIPQVVGLDVLPEQVALAEDAARLLGIENVRFEVGSANDLPFEGKSFDGLCFGGNVLYYRSPPEEKLREFARVLSPGSRCAFELWPMDPKASFSEEAMPLLNADPVSILYSVRKGLRHRSYLIHFRSDSEQAEWLAGLMLKVDMPHGEKRKACREILRAVENGALDAVGKVLYGGEVQYPTTDELPEMLREAGFTDVCSRALPDAVAFARELQQDGILTRMEQADLVPYLRALVAGASVRSGWTNAWITCIRM